MILNVPFYQRLKEGFRRTMDLHKRKNDVTSSGDDYSIKDLLSKVVHPDIKSSKFHQVETIEEFRARNRTNQRNRARQNQNGQDSDGPQSSIVRNNQEAPWSVGFDLDSDSEDSRQDTYEVHNTHMEQMGRSSREGRSIAGRSVESASAGGNSQMNSPSLSQESTSRTNLLSAVSVPTFTADDLDTLPSPVGRRSVEISGSEGNVVAVQSSDDDQSVSSNQVDQVDQMYREIEVSSLINIEDIELPSILMENQNNSSRDADAGSVISEDDINEEEEPQPQGAERARLEQNETYQNMGYYSKKVPKISIYPEFSSNGFFGGVHSGHVICNMMEETIQSGDREIYSRSIYPPCEFRQLNGGQFYMPRFVFNLMKRQRIPSKAILSFAMDLSRLLLDNLGSIDCDKSKLKRNLLNTWNDVYYILHHCINKVQLGDAMSVRFEFFISCDVEAMKHPLIQFDYFKNVINFSPSEKTSNKWEYQLITHLAPLYKFFKFLRESSESPGEKRFVPERLSPALKTRLIWHAEQCLINLEIQKFYGGKISSFFLDKNNKSSYSSIKVPSCYLRKLSSVEQFDFGVVYGLDPRLLSISSKLELCEADVKKIPDFWQQSGNDWRKTMRLPNIFINCVGKVRSTLYRFGRGFIASASIESITGLFQKIRYSKLKTLSQEQSKTMLEHLCIILWSCYDVEWWHILRHIAAHAAKERNITNFNKELFRFSEYPYTRRAFTNWNNRLGEASIFKVSEKFASKKTLLVTACE